MNYEKKVDICANFSLLCTNCNFSLQNIWKYKIFLLSLQPHYVCNTIIMASMRVRESEKTNIKYTK